MTKQPSNIQSIDPLTPTQQGMLFHSLLASNSNVYVVQAVLTLVGDLQPSILQGAWQSMLDRHEALRCQFVWKRQERPLQIVRDRLLLPWEQLDWVGFTAQDQRAKLDSFLRADRKQGFDLSKAPSMRMTLIRMTEQRHVLIGTVHHVLMDGWSLFLVIKDAMALYRARRRGRELQLPPSRPYRDYVSWLQRQDHSKAEAFWRASLDGFDTPTPLSVDRPATTVLDDEDAIVSEQQYWPAELTSALRTFGTRHNLTPSTLVQGAWALLLSRYSGERRVLFGSVISGRPGDLVGVESMVGLFINTLPVLATVSPVISVLAWLKSLQDHLVALQEYGFSSLVEIQGWSQVRRDQPLFESLIAFENYRVDGSVWQKDTDLEIANLTGIERTNYPLTVTVALGEDLSVRVDYDTRRFDGATIKRLLGHFRTLLTEIVMDAERRLSDLPLLTQAERQQMLVEWNKTVSVHPRQDFCLHHLIEEQARRTPNRVAVVFEEHTLTYRELNNRANRLAHRLRAQGVGPDVLVGLLVERSLEMVIGLVGILKAGGAYLPMDPSFPPDRLDYMMSHAGISLVVTQERLLGRMPHTGRTPICLETGQDTNQEIDSSNPTVAVNPSNLAYTIYTSGSTGTPKGVMIEHRSVMNLLLSMQREPGFNEMDVLLAVTTVSFDIAALEIFLPLISGGTLIVASSSEVIDGPRLLRRLEASRATVLQATPATWKLLIEAGWVHSPGLKMLCGGEALARDLANRMLERGGELWNMYGPTETTIWSSARRIDPGPDPVLIGPPVANTQFYIVDEELKPVPIGVPGELVIGGNGLSRGYLNRADLTAERFVESPFAYSARLYRTGDLAKWRADGGIEFLGRLDFQVKVRGYRIELGEVEHVLTRQEGIKEAVVTAWEDQESDKRLVAYYIAAAGSPPQAEALRHALQAKLPSYMIPSAFIPMDAFPLTANGKIDRKALPPPSETPSVITEEFSAPRDALEVALTRIWSRVLKTKQVGLHDNFFDLGGHSFAALRLLSEVQELTGKTLPLATLLQAPTVGALADILRRDGLAPSWSSLVPIQARGSKSPLFVVHAAHGNVLLYRQMAGYIGPDRPVYGLQSEGLSGDDPINSTIEEMASRYVKEIVSVQPHGPYFLAGYCLGGIIAFEIAQQLSAKGEQIGVVILLDSYNFGPISRFSALLLAPVHSLQNLWFHAANSLSLQGPDRRRFLREKADIARTRLGTRLEAAKSALRRFRSPKAYRSDPRLIIQKVNDQAADRYLPRPYSGRVALVRSKGYFWGCKNPTFGWSGVVRGDFVIHELPVHPKGMLIEPFCRLLADAINAEIETVVRTPAKSTVAAIQGRLLRQAGGHVSVRAQTQTRADQSRYA